MIPNVDARLLANDDRADHAEREVPYIIGLNAEALRRTW